MAERVGFEPTVHLLGVQPISSRPRYSRFGTSPCLIEWLKVRGVRHKVKSIPSLSNGLFITNGFRILPLTLNLIP